MKQEVDLVRFPQQTEMTDQCIVCDNTGNKPFTPHQAKCIVKLPKFTEAVDYDVESPAIWSYALLRHVSEQLDNSQPFPLITKPPHHGVIVDNTGIPSNVCTALQKPFRSPRT
ncbi:hypothetical protein VPH35_003048 [Triticum aestivum]